MAVTTEEALDREGEEDLIKETHDLWFFMMRFAVNVEINAKCLFVPQEISLCIAEIVFPVWAVLVELAEIDFKRKIEETLRQVRRVCNRE
jgi:hypothetical protein